MQLALRIRTEGVAAATPLITGGEINRKRITIELDRAALARALDLLAADLQPGLLAIDRPFACRRRGVEMKIVAGRTAPDPDPAMIRALRNAHRWSAALKSGTPLHRLAKDVALSERYVARVIPLAGLSPKIQAAIADGRQPVEWTLERLLRSTLPLDWTDQERTLGFDR